MGNSVFRPLQIEGKIAHVKKFRAWPTGFFHIGTACNRLRKGNSISSPPLIAVRRTLSLVASRKPMPWTAVNFLDALVEAIPGHALASLEEMEPPEFLGPNHTLVRAADRVLGAMAAQQMQESAKEFLRRRAKQP